MSVQLLPSFLRCSGWSLQPKKYVVSKLSPFSFNPKIIFFNLTIANSSLVTKVFKGLVKWKSWTPQEGQLTVWLQIYFINLKIKQYIHIQKGSRSNTSIQFDLIRCAVWMNVRKKIYFTCNLRRSWTSGLGGLLADDTKHTE